MIKINLLSVERPVAKAAKVPFQFGQKITVVCSLIFLVTAVTIGWRYWTLKRESARLDTDIANARKEVTRLESIIKQVADFEKRKADLQERVDLIEQLRKAQTGPVHMLDQISRALPAMLWLTDVKQGANANEVLIEGRCTTLTGLSDFVANLEQSGYFKRSVEILNSQTEPMATPPGELIKFAVRAQFQLPGTEAAKAPAPAEKPAAKPGAIG